MRGRRASTSWPNQGDDSKLRAMSSLRIGCMLGCVIGCLFWTAGASAQESDLGVEMSVSPEQVAAGGTLTYTVTVTNNGPDPAATAGLHSDLPPGVNFTSIVSPP